jgi:hypothetical protein
MVRATRTATLSRSCPCTGERRFRDLLAESDWNALSPDVRQRFSKRIGGARAAVFVGEIVEAELAPCGFLFAQVTRLIGAPLPLRAETGVPAIVTVTEDNKTGGQIWTRLYGSRKGLPQVIHTAKQFAGPTGLEEILGRGFGMSLVVSVEDGAIMFRNARYFVRAFGREWAVPRFLHPGELTVAHIEESDGRFSFTLDIVHPLFGRIVHQRAIFREVLP